MVKQKESYDALINRIFKNPTDREFSVMRDINKHLAYNFYQQLLPGQVVIVALEKNNPKVKSMMVDAEKAQAEWQKHSALSPSNQTFLAHLADFGMDAKRYGGTLVPLKEKKPYAYDPNVNLPDELADIKNQAEAMIAFGGELKNQTVEAYNRLGNKWNSFKIGHTGSQAAISARWQEFKRQNADDFKKIRSAIGKSAMRVDYGMRAEGVGLRQALSKTPSIREPNLSLKSGVTSGIKEYAESLKNAGKFANGLRIGGVVMIGLKFNDYNDKINEVEATGDAKLIKRAKIVERFKLTGDLAGGYGGAVAGIALVGFVGLTGGLGGLILVGVAAAAGGFAGGYLGKEAGIGLGEAIYEFME